MLKKLLNLLNPNKKFLTFKLKCKFCNKETGEMGYPITLGKNATVEDLGISDIRCSKCEKERGTYNEELRGIKSQEMIRKLKLRKMNRKSRKKS